MTKLLLGLFSNTWNPIWDLKEKNFANESVSHKHVGSVLSRLWEKEFQSGSEFELAVFQDTLSDPIDFYPTTYRRFMQIGIHLHDKIRNMFELGFEKGYEKVIFVDPILIFHSTNIPETIQNNWKEDSVLLMPDSQGKIALCGMEEEHFWQFENFEFQAKEAIVEILSDCNSKNISFQLLNSFELEQVEAKMKEAFQTNLY